MPGWSPTPRQWGGTDHSASHAPVVSMPGMLALESPVGPNWGLNDVAEKSSCRERRHTDTWTPRPSSYPCPQIPSSPWQLRTQGPQAAPPSLLPQPGWIRLPSLAADTWLYNWAQCGNRRRCCSFLPEHTHHALLLQADICCLSQNLSCLTSIILWAVHTHTHTHTHPINLNSCLLASAPAVITRIKHSQGTSKVFISSGLISSSSGLCWFHIFTPAIPQTSGHLESSTWPLPLSITFHLLTSPLSILGPTAHHQTS